MDKIRIEVEYKDEVDNKSSSYYLVSLERRRDNPHFI